MFTVNQNDLLEVINQSQNIEVSVKKVVEGKISQAAVLGFSALFTAYIVAMLLSKAFSITLDPTMVGYTALPLLAAIALRICYISTIYSDALLMAAARSTKKY